MDSRIAIAFYKAEGTTFDRLIRWRTRSQYSHVEIVIGSMCYSSSNRDGGVRVKHINLRDDRWDLFAVDGDPERVVRLLARTQGQGYDWLGIVGQAVGIPRLHSRRRWTCSEWAAEALGLSHAWSYTPERLYKRIA